MNERMRWRQLPVTLLVGMLLLSMSTAIVAQGDQCPLLVKQALQELGQNCDSLDRNSACYGFNRVDATFFQDVPTDFFTRPTDRTGIRTLQSIATAPLDVNRDFWGIAVLNVQANIPNTLPGQAVTFVLLGDVSVDNAVDPASAVEPTVPIEVITAVQANVRSGPSTRANVIGSVRTGTIFQADGLSPDENWVRVLFENGPAWLSREVLRPAADLTALSVISTETRSPMQAFYFRTAVGDPKCNEAPSLLVIQGPKNVRVNLNANGAAVSLGSTIVLRLLPGGIVELMVIDGEAVLGDLTVPAGFSVKAKLGDDGKSIVGDWIDFAPLSPDELRLLLTLEGIPTNILHYPIRIPTLADIERAIRLFSQTNRAGDGSVIPGPASARADCRRFRPTSPLDGLAFGLNTFYWDPAPGATSYRLNLYNETGALVGSVVTAAPATSIAADTSGLGGGFSFGWDVTALVDGQVGCTSGRVTLFREVPPEPTREFVPGVCGNGVCEQRYRENPQTCPADCN